LTSSLKETLFPTLGINKRKRRATKKLGLKLQFACNKMMRIKRKDNNTQGFENYMIKIHEPHKKLKKENQMEF
jgi:hypothetical protein